jgi:hypothetical protein
MVSLTSMEWMLGAKKKDGYAPQPGSGVGNMQLWCLAYLLLHVSGNLLEYYYFDTFVTLPGNSMVNVGGEH